GSSTLHSTHRPASSPGFFPSDQSSRSPVTHIGAHATASTASRARSDTRPVLNSTECAHVPQASLVAHSSQRDCPLHVCGLSSRCQKSFIGQAVQLWHQCQVTLPLILR